MKDKFNFKDPVYWAHSVQKAYADEIQNAVNNTIIYTQRFPSRQFDEKFCNEITLEKLGTLEAAEKYKDEPGKLAILNFASYVSPGGGFFRLACTQEEAICHNSFLYNVLKEMKMFYYSHKFENNIFNCATYGLYENQIIYTPGVRVMKYLDDPDSFTCDVITAAAPNHRFYKLCAAKNKVLNEDAYTIALESRIKYVLDVATKENVDTLILGAFGCGAFGNKPDLVAGYFQKWLESGEYGFKRVVFAVPSKGNNYEVFKSVFGGGKEKYE